MSFAYNHLYTIWFISALQNQATESVSKTVTYEVDALYHTYIKYLLRENQTVFFGIRIIHFWHYKV